VAEHVDQREGAVDSGAVAPEFPSRYFPPVTYRDLPEGAPLRRVLGPGVIGAGVGLASGEFILWPYISSQVGLVFLWAAVIGVATQFFINMEIERYTLATGETAVTGFSRFWKHWGLVFAIGAVAANAWPGWASSGATVLTFLLGGGSASMIAVLGLIAVGLALTLSPVVYQALEKTEFVKVALVLLFLVVAVTAGITATAWGDLPQAVTGFGQFPEGLGVALVLGAFAFAGAGGAQNLVQSNWIRDKGFGMGKHAPRLVSPITGEEEAAPSTGWIFREDEGNLARWRAWWKVANTEQLVTFFLISVLTIVLMSLLAYSTVFGKGFEQGLDFLEGEGNVLKETVAPWFGTLFWVIGTVSLFASSLGITDYTSRLVAEVVQLNYLRDSQRWSESRIYAVVVWFIVVAGSVILLTIEEQPVVLLVTSACVGAFMMFVYSGLLIVLNRRTLPPAIKLRGPRLAVMWWSVAFFGVFSAITIWSQGGDLIAKLTGGD
jgi:hypothetical protein